MGDTGHLYMQWIELMELCMVNLVWDTKSYSEKATVIPPISADSSRG